MKTNGPVVILLAITLSGGAGALGAQLASPSPANAVSDAAILRRIDQHIGSGYSNSGTGLWKQIYQLRQEQAEFCRAAVSQPELCPTPSD